MKAPEQYVRMVYYAEHGVSFKSVNEILVYDHSFTNESYLLISKQSQYVTIQMKHSSRAVLSCDTVYYAVQRGPNF